AGVVHGLVVEVCWESILPGLLTDPVTAGVDDRGSSTQEQLMQPDCLILYVNSPAESVAFYRALLGRDPVEQ
ncbi:hypothetical protein, partial [Stenotrophomonas maltophilia]|uniref:hypothetical protein n=1 Tax=Stenotrophomonas maltophilia TaxID=40324 RepID=UPI001954DB8F